MMPCLPQADISGALLSSLFFDGLRCSGDQEGFLFGEVVTRIIGCISDSQLNHEKEETIISLQRYQPCNSVFSFYDNAGRVDGNKLRSMLQDDTKKLVGWYRFRRNTTPALLLRERAIHHNLLTFLSSEHCPLFLYGIFCGEDNGSTYTFNHGFYFFSGREFAAVTLSIVNLGDTSQTEYRLHQQHTVNRNSGMYSKILPKCPVIDAKGSSTQSEYIHQLQSSLHTGFQGLCEDMLKSKETIEKLTADVQRLKLQLNLSSQKPKISEFQLPGSSMHTVSHMTTRLTKESFISVPNVIKASVERPEELHSLNQNDYEDSQDTEESKLEMEWIQSHSPKL